MSDITLYTRPRYIESRKSSRVYLGSLKTPVLSRVNDNILRWNNLDTHADAYVIQICSNMDLLNGRKMLGSIDLQDTAPALVLPSSPSKYDCYSIGKSKSGLASGSTSGMKDSNGEGYSIDASYGEEVIYDGSRWVKLWSVKSSEIADFSGDAMQLSMTENYIPDDGTYSIRIRAMGAGTYNEDIPKGDSEYVEGGLNQRTITVEFYSAWSDSIEPFTIDTLAKADLRMESGTCGIIWDAIPNADSYSLMYQRDNSEASYMQFDSNSIPKSYLYLDSRSEFADPGIYWVRVIPSSKEHWFLHRTRASSESDTLRYAKYKLAIPILDGEFDVSTYTQKWKYPTSQNGRFLDANGNVMDPQPSLAFNAYLNDKLVSTGIIAYNYSFEGDISADVSSYRGYITSIVANQVAHANPMYLSSERSEYIDFGVLPAPVISWTKMGSVHINNISAMSAADSFSILFNDSEIASIPVNSNDYDISILTPTSMTITYVAKSDKPTIADSAKSNALTYIATKLMPPEIYVSKRDGSDVTISWSAVSSANVYDVYLNGALASSTGATSMTLRLPSGGNSIYAIAKSDSIGISGSSLYRYLDSDKSNGIFYNQEALYEYSAVIIDSKHGGEYDVQLPFTVSHYLDETLDTASITLAPCSVNEPFEAFDQITIKMSMGTGSIQKSETFCIEKDDLEEVMVGDSSVWLHHITCIESTKLLEQEIMPDFSITQPLSFVTADYRMGNMGAAYILNKDKDGKIHDPIRNAQMSSNDMSGMILTSTYITNLKDAMNGSKNGFWKNSFSFANDPGGVIGKTLDLACAAIPVSVAYAISGLNDVNGNRSTFTSNVKTVYTTGDKIPLPIETATSFTVYRKYDIDTSSMISIMGAVLYLEFTRAGLMFGSQSCNGKSIPTESMNSLLDLGIMLRKTYKYRKHSKPYESAGTETVITSYVEDSDSPKTNLVWDTSALPSGEYDIILEVGMDFSKASITESEFKSSMHFQDGFVSNNDWAYWFKTINDNLIFNIVTACAFTITDLVSLIGRNPEMKDMSSKSLNDIFASSGTQVFANVRDYDYMINTLDSACQYRMVVCGSDDSSKGISISGNPSTYRTFSGKSMWEALNRAVSILNPISVGESPKYHIDPALRPMLENVACPEMSFSGGKSLFEVLFEMGRVFYGYPRLASGNEITFTILDSTAMRNAIAFNDDNTLRTRESGIDNHSTGFVSKLSNVISKRDWIVYPSGNVWARARSIDDSECLMTVANAGIVTDKPINAIKAVLCAKVGNQDDASYSDMPVISDIIDITPYVYEATMYGALNGNADGKGSALYYSRGDNKICNLGVMSEGTKFQAVMNWESDRYAIHNILHLATGMSMADVQSKYPIWSLGFKVIYQTTDGLTAYTEQSNVSGLANQTYRVLNQESNTVLDSAFGQSAQTQIERLGNNSIRKTYMLLSSDWDGIPEVGRFSEFEGYRYYIDEVSYQFGNEYCKISVNLSKNFNKINERIGTDSEYRLYSIYSSENVIRNVNVNEYCYVSTWNYNISAPKISSTYLPRDIQRSLEGNPEYYPNYFYVRPLESDGSRSLTYTKYDTSAKTAVPCSLISAQPYKFKTSIAFSGRFKDNFSSGTHMTKSDAEVLSRANSDPIFKNDTSRFLQSDVRYVDDAGECPVMGMTLLRPTDSDMKSYLGVNSMSYPEANNIMPSNLSHQIYSQNIDLEKDNRERIELTYQLHFMTFDKSIHIHSGLASYLYKPEDSFIKYIKQSGLKTEFQDMVIPSRPKYYLCRDDLRMVDSIPQTSSTDGILIGTPEITRGSNMIRISCKDKIIAPVDCRSIALAWGDRTMAFDITVDIKSGEEASVPDIYLNLMDSKAGYFES